MSETGYGGSILKKWDNLTNILRILAILTFLFVIFFGTTRVAYAILYNISVTDGSVAEWGTQSIPVFQTDDTGEPGVNPGEDIVQAWTASGHETGTRSTWPAGSRQTAW